MSKNKSKITKWEYVTEPFDVLVEPATVKRVHSPLGRSLSPHYTDGELYLHLRPCVQGVDEDGAVVKHLYCTRDGRFFTRGKNGWNEVLPNTSIYRKSSKKGSKQPTMRNFGSKPCHLCVIYAWTGKRPEGKVCDHLDTNLLNMSADNLQWVTVAENRRRGKIARQLRKAAIDPKLLTPTLCRGIYTLPEERIGELIERFKMCCVADDGELSVENIRINVATALDAMKSSSHSFNSLNS